MAQSPAAFSHIDSNSAAHWQSRGLPRPPWEDDREAQELKIKKAICPGRGAGTGAGPESPGRAVIPSYTHWKGNVSIL